MKTNFLLAARLWTKNKASNIMVMLLALLTFYLVSSLYNQYQSYYETANYYEKTPLNSSVLFMGREPVISDDNDVLTDPKYIQEFVEYSKKSGIVSSLSGMCNGVSIINNGDIIYTDLRAYDALTASFVKNTLSIQGKWLFEEENSDYYPVVVRNGDNTDYKIGDKFSVDIELVAATNVIGSSNDSKKVTVQCIVVGISTNPLETAFFLGSQKSNFADTIENTFLGCSLLPNSTLIYFPYDDRLFNDFIYTNDTVLAYFKEDATNEQIYEFYEHVCKLGYSQLGSDIIAASRAEGDYKFKKNFFVFYSLIILMIASILCVSFLNIKKIKKIFAVYYLNGCTIAKSIVVYFLYFILLYTLPLLIYIAVTKLQYIYLANSTYGVDFIKSAMFEIDVRVPIVAWLIGIIVSALASIVPFAAMKGKSIIMNLREN